ncbi:hypothetical protein L873DRAFT_1816992 [Choiromyces venosus 120613-1]|uniref:Transmembrane protein n=1 Tax=Choiromyces venosus 120613-1 TaxID=1336337 RepID=A0A3N4J8R4_9PEZI|nr:hypothetical protein L873DRAFT_1816992 [Choiromyces venosus 120613-1]
MSESTPLLHASPDAPPNTPAVIPVIPPVFLELESQAAYYRAREAQEEEYLRGIRRQVMVNTIIVVATVFIGVLMIGLLACFGGMAAKRRADGDLG